ncbi:Gp19/Gp15/Gp42 family protein [Kocuria sp. KH4]
MANTLHITVEAVTETYEGDIDLEDEQTVTWLQGQIDKAVRALLGDCPTLLRRWAAKTVDHLLVQDVVVDAVLRVVRDEDPTMKGESESGYSYTKNPLMASGDIWFPDKDLRRIGCKAVEGGFVGKARTKPRQPWGWPL